MNKTENIKARYEGIEDILSEIIMYILFLVSPYLKIFVLGGKLESDTKMFVCHRYLSYNRIKYLPNGLFGVTLQLL